MDLRRTCTRRVASYVASVSRRNKRYESTTLRRLAIVRPRLSEPVYQFSIKVIQISEFVIFCAI